MARWRRPIVLMFLCASCSFKDPDKDLDVGSGPITLSPHVQANFEAYKALDRPMYFVVTESGVGSYSIYCPGRLYCSSPTARIEALAQCRKDNPGAECKVYAMGRVVVWQDAGARRPRRQLSVADRLVRECLEGDTPEIRIDKCSQAIASSELAPTQKRGAYYVRGRAYEQIGILSEAEQDYGAVLAIDPDHAPARARLENLRASAARRRTNFTGERVTGQAEGARAAGKKPKRPGRLRRSGMWQWGCN
jgi:hypothetical protein